MFPLIGEYIPNYNDFVSFRLICRDSWQQLSKWNDYYWNQPDLTQLPECYDNQPFHLIYKYKMRNNNYRIIQYDSKTNQLQRLWTFNSEHRKHGLYIDGDKKQMFNNGQFISNI